jgi:hypothetical protein
VARAFGVSDLGAVREQLRRGVRAARAERRAPAPEVGRPPPSAPPPAPLRLPELEAQVVGAFLDHPALHASGHAEKVQELLTSRDLRAILALTTRWVGSRGIDASILLGEIADSPARTWLERRLAVQHFQDEASARRFVDRAVPLLERERAKHENRRLRRELLEARRVGDEERVQALMRQMTELFQSAARGGTRDTKR